MDKKTLLALSLDELKAEADKNEVKYGVTIGLETLQARVAEALGLSLKDEPDETPQSVVTVTLHKGGKRVVGGLLIEGERKLTPEEAADSYIMRRLGRAEADRIISIKRS